MWGRRKRTSATCRTKKRGGVGLGVGGSRHRVRCCRYVACCRECQRSSLSLSLSSISRWYLSLSFSVCLCLSLSVSFCLSLSLSVSLCLSPCIYLSTFYLPEGSEVLSLSRPLSLSRSGVVDLCVTNLLSQKRRSELGVRLPWLAMSGFSRFSQC
jgi:hypothetical protein